jgi:hypothetical protein
MERRTQKALRQLGNGVQKKPFEMIEGEVKCPKDTRYKTLS